MPDEIEGQEDEQQQQQSVADREVEERARIQGWRPKDEFPGDPANWRPAAEFVRRADEMMPIMKSVNKRLEGQVSELSRKLDEQSKMIDRMVHIQSKVSEDNYSSRLSDIKGRKRRAAEDQDWATYDRLELEEGTLARPEPIKPQDTPSTENHTENAVHPDVSRWIGENSSWFNVDSELTNYAMFIGEQMKQGQHQLARPGNEYEFCQEVKRRVQATFPQKFRNPNQQRHDIDESGLRGGDNLDASSGGKKGWNDLPKDAKSQCLALIDSFKLQGKTYTKEQYVKDYFEGE